MLGTCYKVEHKVCSLKVYDSYIEPKYSPSFGGGGVTMSGSVRLMG